MVALMVGCGAEDGKVEPCGDGFDRADDGKCEPIGADTDTDTDSDADDIDGDGLDDVIVGACYGESGGITYLLFGE